MGALPRIFILEGNWLRRSTMLLGPLQEEEEFMFPDPESEQRFNSVSSHLYDGLDAQLPPRTAVNELELEQFTESTLQWINLVQGTSNRCGSSEPATEGAQPVHPTNAYKERPNSTVLASSRYNGSLYVETPRSTKKKKTGSLSRTPHSNNEGAQESTVHLSRGKSIKSTSKTFNLSKDVKNGKSSRSDTSKGTKVQTKQNTAKKKQNEDITPSKNPSIIESRANGEEKENMINEKCGSNSSDSQSSVRSDSVSSSNAEQVKTRISRKLKSSVNACKVPEVPERNQSSNNTIFKVPDKERYTNKENDCVNSSKPIISSHNNNNNELTEGIECVSPDGGEVRTRQLQKRKSPIDTFKVPVIPKKIKSSKNSVSRAHSKENLLNESSECATNQKSEISNSSHNSQSSECATTVDGGGTKMTLRPRKPPINPDKAPVSKGNGSSQIKGERGELTKCNPKKKINGSIIDKTYLDAPLNTEGKEVKPNSRSTNKALRDMSSVVLNKDDTSLWSTGSKITSTPIIKKRGQRSTMNKNEQVKSWLNSQSNKSSHIHHTKGNRDLS